MNRRSKTARLLTGGLIGASTTPLPGDEHWDDVTLLLDGSSLTDDLSTAGNNTADEGATLVQVTGPYNSTQNVLNFDATGSSSSSGNYIETGVSADFKFGTSPFTIEMWLKPDVTNTGSQTNSLATILDYGWYDTGSTTGAWFALHQVNSELSFVIDNGNSTTTTSSSGLSTTNWAHVAIVRNATNTLNIYVDGVSKASGSFNFNLSDTLSRPLSIGYQPGQARHYDGQIADLRITKGVARYTANFTPPAQKFLPFAARPYSGTFGLGDEYWDDVTLLLDGSSPTNNLKSGGATVTNPNDPDVTTTTTDPGSHPYATSFLFFNPDSAEKLTITQTDAGVAFGSNDFTIETWIYFASGQNTVNSAIFDWRSSTGGPVLYVEDNTKVRLFVNGGDQILGATTLSDQTWYHVALTVENNIARVFLDGNQEGSSWNSGATSFAPQGDFQIGYKAYAGSGLTRFNGHMTDIRITKGVARYTGPFTPPQASFPTNAPVVGRRGVGSVPAVDTFATLDPVYFSGSATNLSEGNLKSVGSGAAVNSYRISTTEYNSNAKVYFELRLNTTDGSYQGVGVGWDENTDTSGVCLLYYSGGSLTRFGPAGTNQQLNLSGLSAGAIIGVAADIGAREVQFYKDGSTFGNLVQNATLTDLNKASIFQIYSGSATLNFGQDHTFANAETALATPYTDANGLGEFYYQPPAGFTGLYTTIPGTLRTRGYLGAAPAAAGDAYWNDVNLLISGSGVTAGGSVTDLSTQGNNFTSVSTNSLSTTGPYGTTQDVLDFNGSPDYLVETTGSGDFKFGTDDFTIEAWLKATATAAGFVPGIIDHDVQNNSANGNDYFVLHQHGGGLEYAFYANNTSGSIVALVTATAPTTGWHHLAITRSGTTVKMFLDGVLEDTSTNLVADMSSARVNPKLFLGFQNNDSRYWDGQMADLRITKGVARDIAADWTAGLYDDPPFQNQAQRPAGMLTLYDRYIDNLS